MTFCLRVIMYCEDTDPGLSPILDLVKDVWSPPGLSVLETQSYPSLQDT